MSTNDKYYNFPLSVLRGIKGREHSPLDIIDLCLNCGLHNAGVGYKNKHGTDAFDELLDETLDHFDYKTTGWSINAKEIIVGAQLTDTRLGCQEYASNSAKELYLVDDSPPYVTMSSKSLWAAIYQARWESNPIHYDKPDHGLSWSEFRVLAAILSCIPNGEKFRSISEASIAVRACGFASKAKMEQAPYIPEHLLPKLGRWRIKQDREMLEQLKFFACYNDSKVGGKTYYSFTLSNDDLGKSVRAGREFRNRNSIREKRIKQRLNNDK